jgi:hypothetical protein
MHIFGLHRRSWWMVRAFGPNPLLRRIDRIEAILTVMAIVAAVAVIPVAAAVGAAVYGSHARLYADEALTRHSVAATVIESMDRCGRSRRRNVVRRGSRTGRPRRHDSLAAQSNPLRAVGTRDQQPGWRWSNQPARPVAPVPTGEFRQPGIEPGLPGPGRPAGRPRRGTSPGRPSHMRARLRRPSSSRSRHSRSRHPTGHTSTNGWSTPRPPRPRQ